MPCLPEEIMGVAESLSAAGGEASDRSAVSRAYYALMLTFREGARAVNPQLDLGRGVHGNLIRYLRSTRSGILGKVAMDLEALRDLRELADYELHEQLTPDRVLEVVTRAKKWIGSMPNLKPLEKIRP